MAYLGAGLTRFNTADELTVTGDAQIDTNTLVVDSTNNRVGILNASPTTALDVNGTLTASTVAVAIVDVSNEIQLEGAAGNDGLIQKNASSGRDELQIYAGGDAYESGSRGAGIHLYGNSDSEHDGNFAVLTGPNDNGDGRLIVSGRVDKTHVTIGNGIWNYVDNGNDPALLNLYNPTSQPAILIEGASATEGDIVAIDGEALQFGHWNKTSSSFTERLRISSSGKIGIGTTSPDQTLHVHKGSAGSVDSATNAVITLENSTHGILQFLTPNNVSNQIRFGDVNDNGRGYIDYNHSTDNLSIAVGGSEAARFDASGNLGIGTSAPHDSGANFSMLTLNGPKGGGIVFSDDDVNQHQIYTTDDASLRFARGSGLSDESMRIDSSGNVGIGDSSPFSKLHVEDTSWSSGAPYGTVLYVNGGGVNDNNWGHLFITQTSTSTGSGGKLSFGSNGDNPFAGIKGYYAGGTYGHLDFYTRPSGGTATMRMRVDSSGNLLLGTTNTSIATSNSDYGAVITNGGRIFSTVNGDHHDLNRASSNGELIRLRRGGTQVGSISVDGSSTSFNTSSDYRLKENISDISDGITRVKQLSPKRFNFIAEPDTTVDGFLAHEAQTVVPEAVTGTHNEVEVWAEGEELPDGVSVGDNKLDDGNTIPVMQGIDQAKLVPLLTAALQEAIAKIETLETKVAALEAN